MYRGDNTGIVTELHKIVMSSRISLFSTVISIQLAKFPSTNLICNPLFSSKHLSAIFYFASSLQWNASSCPLVYYILGGTLHYTILQDD